jgi:hypothetical protein
MEVRRWETKMRKTSVIKTLCIEQLWISASCVPGTLLGSGDVQMVPALKNSKSDEETDKGIQSSAITWWEKTMQERNESQRMEFTSQSDWEKEKWQEKLSQRRKL